MYKKLLVLGLVLLGSCGSYEPKDDPEASPATMSVSVNLSNLSFSEGEFSPEFLASKNIYSINLSENSVDVALELENNEASVKSVFYKPDGSSSTYSTLNFQLLFTENENYKLEIIVSASNNSKTNKYTVYISKLKVTGLTDINIVDENLSPIFDSNQGVYTLSVSSDKARINVNANKINEDAILKINDTVRDSEQNKPVDLSFGINTITLEIKKGLETSIYKIYVLRGNSSVNLSNLAVSKGTLSPSFATNTIIYSVQVNSSVTEIAITPSIDDTDAVIKVNNDIVVSEHEKIIVLGDEGSFTAIEIKVTSSNKQYTKVYTIYVERKES